MKKKKSAFWEVFREWMPRVFVILGVLTAWFDEAYAMACYYIAVGIWLRVEDIWEDKE